MNGNDGFQPIKAEWVKGKFRGDQAKLVKAHADAGLTYFIKEESGRGASYEVIAAFRRAMDTPRPGHLVPCSMQEINSLESMRLQRSGIKGGI